MALAQNIRYLRKKQGWGQDVLAEKLGYKSYTTIQKWESGVSEPPLKVVHELAAIFCVDINDLANGDLENGKVPTGIGERSVSDNEIKFALFRGREDITDAMYEEVLNFAEYVARREEEKKRKE